MMRRTMTLSLVAATLLPATLLPATLLPATRLPATGSASIPRSTDTRAAGPSATTDEKVLKVFDSWLRSYRRGRVDMRNRRDISSRSILIKSGLLSSAPRGGLTAQRELEYLLDRVVRIDAPEAAIRVLRVAGTGLDRSKYTYEHAPTSVRELGERTLGRLRGDARDAIGRVASGELVPGGGKTLELMARAAALRAVGAEALAAHRLTLEEALGEDAAPLRLAAADGLRGMNAAESARAVVDALVRETDEPALIGMVGALQRMFETHHERIDAAVLARGVKTVAASLGRVTWHGDMAIIEFLGKCRAREAVPALIALLGEIAAKPGDVKAGKLPGMLRFRAHETLVAITGAMFPANRVDQWREWWTVEQANFRVLARKRGGDEPRKPGTVAGGFFGVPVQGTRVVFVIDVSGSMRQPYPRGRGTSAGGRGGGGPRKIDVAKEELQKAVNGLPKESRFNVVLFSERVDSWQSKLALATNANKKRLAKFLATLEPRTSTNLWGGMQQGLKIKSLVYGDRYDSNVDELFLLSDGAPTSGEILDSAQILKTVNETNRFSGVRINTVFIGSDNEGRGGFGRGRRGGGGGGRRGGGRGGGGWMAPSDLMKRIAEANGGKFVRPQ